MKYVITGFMNGILNVKYEDSFLTIPLLLTDGKYPEGEELDRLILDHIQAKKDSILYNTTVVATNSDAISALVARESQPVEDLSAMERLVRVSRSRILQATDWTQMVDSPVEDLVKTQWADFRSALRDISDQEGFPLNVRWPLPPLDVFDIYGTKLLTKEGILLI